MVCVLWYFFFQAEDGIRDAPLVTGVQTCALPICQHKAHRDGIEAGENLVGESRRARIGEILLGLAGLAPVGVDRILTGIEIRLVGLNGPIFSPQGDRSEEHTSELQSLMRISYAVFCLKKKTNNHEVADIKANLLHQTQQYA